MKKVIVVEIEDAPEDRRTVERIYEALTAAQAHGGAEGIVAITYAYGGTAEAVLECVVRAQDEGNGMRHATN